MSEAQEVDSRDSTADAFVGSVWIEFPEFGTLVLDAGKPSRVLKGPVALDATLEGVGYPQTGPTCARGGCRRTFENATLIFSPDGRVKSRQVHYPEGKPGEKVTDIGSGRYAAADNFLVMEVGGHLRFAEAKDGVSFASGLEFRRNVLIGSGYQFPPNYTFSGTSTAVAEPLSPCD